MTLERSCHHPRVVHMAISQPRSTGLPVNDRRVSLAPGVAGARLMMATSLTENIVTMSRDASLRSAPHVRNNTCVGISDDSCRLWNDAPHWAPLALRTGRLPPPVEG